MEYRFESFSLNVERRELHCGGELRHVEPQVFDLLHFLIVNRERVVGRDEIFQAVWHGRIVSDIVLSTRINAVRAAIGDDGTQQRLIRTVRGGGFRFVGAVSTKTSGSEPPTTAAVPVRRLALALPEAPLIVVRPFVVRGPGRFGGIIAEGLVEEIVANLCQIDWLFVAASALDPNVLRAKSRKTACGIGACYLLHGNVRTDGDTARIVLRLTEAESGVHLWAERFAGEATGAFALHEEIAAKVAAAVGDQVFAAEDIRSKHSSPQSRNAWQSIVAALALINTRSREKARTAQALLRRAIALDAKSAPAFALSSFVKTLGLHQGWDTNRAVGEQAARDAKQALALDSNEAWSHVSAGYVSLHVHNRPEQAIETLKQALALNPNLAVAHYLIALALTYLGKPEDAFQRAELAERLRSRDLLARGNAGAHDNVRATASFVAGRYHEGLQFARRAIMQSPRQISAYRQLLVNSALIGDFAQAGQALQMVKQLAPDVRKFLKQSERLWTDKADYQKYVEAFRMAGHR